MKMTNKSSLDTKEVSKLLKWISDQCSWSLSRVRLSIDSVRKRPYLDSLLDEIFYGANPKETSACTKSDKIVEYWVGVSKYPYTSEYVKEVGKVRICNWREEFVLFISHEFKHVDQFARLGPDMLIDTPTSRDELEEEAERFGMKLLKRYRKLVAQNVKKEKRKARYSDARSRGRASNRHDSNKPKGNSRSTKTNRRKSV